MNTDLRVAVNVVGVGARSPIGRIRTYSEVKGVLSA